MSAKFEVFKSEKNSQFYFHLKAANGQIVLASEGYTTKQNCLNGISSVKENSVKDHRYDLKQNKTNYSFNLKAGNGEIIGVSQVYKSEQSSKEGVEAVMKAAQKAVIEDLTVRKKSVKTKAKAK